MKQHANYTEDPIDIEGKFLFVATDDETFEIIRNISYCLAAINTLIGIIAVLGNGLVLYAAYGNRNNGRLNYLDGVIKSLAVNDLIYGLIGIPCRTVSRFDYMRFLHTGK